jgi:hypothetical protein
MPADMPKATLREFFKFGCFLVFMVDNRNEVVLHLRIILGAGEEAGAGGEFRRGFISPLMHTFSFVTM